MKTTVELPDELVREVKVRAAREGRRLKDVMAEVVRRGLADSPGRKGTSSSQVRLPLVQCAHRATPSREMTPERTAEILLAAEVGAAGTVDEPVR
ncbi:MAG: antitoxin [Acidimicrobiales bacterium]